MNRLKFPDGQIVRMGQSFERAGTKYPANWLEAMSDVDREALGLAPVPDAPNFDPRFYSCVETSPGVYELADQPVDFIRATVLPGIDAAAELARGQYITTGAGQAMTYQRKLEEARLFVNGAPGPFPIIEACVGADGATVAEVAAVVIATAEAWSAIAAQIEGMRLGAKRAIQQATTAAEIEAALAAIVWPAP